MTLTADIGNTRIKIVLFDHDKPVYIRHYTDIGKPELDNVYAQYDVTTTIISSVNDRVYRQLAEYLAANRHNYITLTRSMPLPFKTAYRTPQTLGLDRISGMTGACALHPDNPLLVIDAGTCITYDLIVDGVFLGGNIAPGLDMRLQAMHRQTSALPDTATDTTVAPIGHSTAEAMQAGAFWGLIYEINGYIGRYSKKYPALRTILTGGNAEQIAPHITDKAIWELQPLLIPIGLNFIANNLSK